MPERPALIAALRVAFRVVVGLTIICAVAFLPVSESLFAITVLVLAASEVGRMVERQVPALQRYTGGSPP